MFVCGLAVWMRVVERDVYLGTSCIGHHAPGVWITLARDIKPNLCHQKIAFPKAVETMWPFHISLQRQQGWEKTGDRDGKRLSPSLRKEGIAHPLVRKLSLSILTPLIMARPKRLIPGRSTPLAYSNYCLTHQTFSFRLF